MECRSRRPRAGYSPRACGHRSSSRLGCSRDCIRRPRSCRPAPDRAGRAGRGVGTGPSRREAARRRRGRGAHRNGSGLGGARHIDGAGRAHNRDLRTHRVDVAAARGRSTCATDIVMVRRAPYEARADSVMYREVLAELARAAGTSISTTPRTSSSKRRTPSARADAVLRGPARRSGRPGARTIGWRWPRRSWPAERRAAHRRCRGATRTRVPRLRIGRGRSRPRWWCGACTACARAPSPTPSGGNASCPR